MEVKSDGNALTKLEEAGSGGVFGSVPHDVILRCIAPYVRKREQYVLLSTCKEWGQMLRGCRTVCVSSDNHHMGPAALWSAFLPDAAFREKILKSVGCSSMQVCCNVRSLRVRLSMEELIISQDFLCELAHLCYRIETKWKSYKGFPTELLPGVLDNPTAMSIKRWLKSQIMAYDATAGLQQIHETVQSVANEIGTESFRCSSLSAIRGVKRIMFRQDSYFILEYGPRDDTPLHSVVVDQCEEVRDLSALINVPDVQLKTCHHIVEIQGLARAQSVLISGCRGISDMSPLAQVQQVVLEDLIGLTDVRMLGNVRLLRMARCTSIGGTIQYPQPLRRDYSWAFVDMGTRGVSVERYGSIRLVPNFRTLEKSSQWTENVEVCKCSNFEQIFYLYLIKTEYGTYHIDNDTLKAAVRLWCAEEAAARSIFGDISFWDVRNVNNMADLFRNQSRFNRNINCWDVCNVTDMQGMFRGAHIFNQPLNSWEVGNVENMSHMFHSAGVFNQSLDSWNVSKVTEMQGMFRGTFVFNQSLATWDVSNVTDMAVMFDWAVAFNQPLRSWDVSKVRNMEGMFLKASSFNQPLDSWDVSHVASMSHMLAYATSFNQPLDSWDVSNVVQMEGMFSGASAFNQSLDGWNVSNVSIMSGMFNGATTFNQPLNSWNVSRVTDMRTMFVLATSFNQPLSSWDVSNVKDMQDMFASASSFNQSLQSWNVHKDANTKGMLSPQQANKSCVIQ